LPSKASSKLVTFNGFLRGLYKIPEVVALSVERNLVISALKLTKEGCVLIEDVNRDAHVPSAVACKLLQKLQNEDLIYLKAESVEADSSCRLKLAVKAVSLGADLELISKLLSWQEFEEIAAFALKNNGYTVQKNVHFTHEGKRWEIDVVGCKKPLVICVDCKHWGRAITPSALSKIVDAQVDRSQAFADSLPNVKLKIPCTQWEKAKFVPAVLSLIQSCYKYVHQVPVVPVLQLQNFIAELPLYTGELKFCPKTFTSLRHDF
jgi:Holliday junction resolvase-like predicted endonuclease